MNPNPNPNPSPNPSDPPPPRSDEYAPYPKIDLEDIPLASPSTDTWTSVHVGTDHDHAPPPPSPPPPPPLSDTSASRDTSAPFPATTMHEESNPYVSPAPSSEQASSMKYKMELVKDVLGKWGKKAAETTKKAEDLAGDMWQHLKTSPSLADAAVARIAQGTKVFAEGGYEKVFRQNFETAPEENLLNSFACYLSTSAGPVMGTLYLSTAKVAFCSDSPLSYKVGEDTQWSYYKVVLPLHQLRAVNTSTSKVNSAEKYIQISSVDNHEFWFMGFVYYESATKSLQGALQPPQP